MVIDQENDTSGIYDDGYTVFIVSTNNKSIRNNDYGISVIRELMAKKRIWEEKDARTKIKEITSTCIVYGTDPDTNYIKIVGLLITYKTPAHL